MLGFIQFFNVTSANEVRFLPKIVHIIIQVYGTTVANLVMIWLSIDPLLPCGLPHARVHELGSIRFFNVTSANVVYFLPKCVHLVIQVYATTVAMVVIVQFIFTILLNMTRCCPVILHVLRGIITSAWNTCKITGQQRIMFNKIVNINHIITKFATFVPYTCVVMSLMCTKFGKTWTTIAEVA